MSDSEVNQPETLAKPDDTPELEIADDESQFERLRELQRKLVNTTRDKFHENPPLVVFYVLSSIVLSVTLAEKVVPFLLATVSVAIAYADYVSQVLTFLFMVIIYKYFAKRSSGNPRSRSYVHLIYTILFAAWSVKTAGFAEINMFISRLANEIELPHGSAQMDPVFIITLALAWCLLGAHAYVEYVGAREEMHGQYIAILQDMAQSLDVVGNATWRLLQLQEKTAIRKKSGNRSRKDKE